MEHDRFILGSGASGRLYITHTQAPRMTCEFWPEGKGAPENAIDAEEGAVGNFKWIDDAAADEKMRVIAEIPAALRKINA